MEMARRIPSALEHLSAGYRYQRFRYHRLFDAGELAHMSSVDAAGLAELPDARVALSADGRAAAVIARQEWDSCHFGRPVFNLGVWHDDADDEALAGLLEEVLAELEPGAVVCTHVDSEDYPLLNGLFASGFAVRDLKRTYIARRHQPAWRRGPLILPARPYEDADHDAVSALIASVSFESRFSRDPAFASDRASALYRRWFQRLIDTPKEERELLVVERRGALVAVGGVRSLGIQERYGFARRILGDGVFACNTQGRGSYVSVIDGLISRGIRRSDLLETQVSNGNLAAIRVLERLGYSSATAQYALHYTASD